MLYHFFFFFFPGLYLTGHSVSDVFGFVDDVGILIFCGGKTSIAADRRGDFQVWIVMSLLEQDLGVADRKVANQTWDYRVRIKRKSIVVRVTY